MNAMDEAVGTFVAESRDLLDQMEASLLLVEQNPDDPEVINAIFRAAHTIKGSSGIFGFDHIVAFTHVAESVLDAVRAGDVRMTPSLTGVLLRSGDHLRTLVDLVAARQPPQATHEAESRFLSDRLRICLAEGSHAPLTQTPDPAPSERPLDSEVAAPRIACGHWHLSIRFGPDTFRDGFDPLSFIRYLESFGAIMSLRLVVDLVPDVRSFDPESCHLGFEIALETQADRSRIESTFDFVRESSNIRLLEPHASFEQVRVFLSDFGEEKGSVCDWLGEFGTLNQDELAVVRSSLTLHEPATGAPMEQEPLPLEPAVRHGQPAHAAPREARVETNLLRVDAAKLDHLIDLVGELVIAGAGVAMTARKHRDKEMMQSAANMMSLVEGVRDSALNLRMVQIGATFARYQRVVRDVSQELGKDIELQISGGQTELDKTVVERLADPLTHLVRNAMDHGIESACERQLAGKCPRGTVSLHAYHEAGWVVVEVGDDGRGLDRDKILRKGIERGLVSPEANLSEQEIYQLIFQPGFSTAATVSNLSGRGVGMDVVKRAISALRGSVEILTQPGKGATIRVRLPLTLAIIDGFLMGVGTAAYVVPLSSVEECIELDPGQPSDRDWLDLRGRGLPLIRLRQLHGVEGAPGRRQNVVVVDGGGMRVGLVVDQLMGEAQTVIKPLGRVFQGLPGIGGFTILGNGAVALLLDVPRLVDLGRSRDASLTEPHAATNRVLPAAVA